MCSRKQEFSTPPEVKYKPNMRETILRFCSALLNLQRSVEISFELCRLF